MRILGAVSMGGAGHLNPLRSVLAVARQRGDDVLIIAPPSMRAQVLEAGFEFRPGGEPAERDVAPIREALPVAPPEEALILGNRELFARLAARAMLPAMERVIAQWQPELIVRDPCEYASAVIAARLGVPTAQVAISLADAEWASIRAAAPALEEHCAGLVEALIASPYLTRFPASLDPSRFPRTIRFREPTPAPVPLPEWWDGSCEPLIYLTFGTVFGYLSDAARAYQVAARAVAELPARVLVTTGRLDPAALGALPPNVHVESWVEQPDALAAADLVVCHGGSGTVFGALAAGLPLVVVPSFADQLTNGRRVAAVGAGLLVETAQNPGPRMVGERDAARITTAATDALSLPGYRAAARRIGAELAAAPPVADVLGGAIGRPPSSRR